MAPPLELVMAAHVVEEPSALAKERFPSHRSTAGDDDVDDVDDESDTIAGVNEEANSGAKIEAGTAASGGEHKSTTSFFTLPGGKEESLFFFKLEGCEEAAIAIW